MLSPPALIHSYWQPGVATSYSYLGLSTGCIGGGDLGCPLYGLISEQLRIFCNHGRQCKVFLISNGYPVVRLTVSVTRQDVAYIQYVRTY